MREGVASMLKHHFGESIAKRFILSFEVDIYHDDNKNIWKQKKDNNYIMEVRYKTGEDTSEYLCDLYSWETPQMIEAKLLRYITDKYKAKLIGQDWVLKNGRMEVSDVITSGKYETKDDSPGGHPDSP